MTKPAATSCTGSSSRSAERATVRASGELTQRRVIDFCVVNSTACLCR